ncbi:MAG: sigma-70 family RNA polymerase sigma factor [Sphingobacteriales bacterium]|nr:MAG: sigma-70 family RNA polymerase sigma factor [Sphingobacteriales bacterium]
MEEPPKFDKLSDEERDNIIIRDFVPFSDALLNFAFRLTYDEAKAEDLVQDTFEKACKAISTFQVGTNAKAWLFTILRNIFINDYRKSKKKQITGTFEDVEKQHHHVDGKSANTIDFGDETFKEMLGDEVLEAVESLQDDFRTIIFLDLEDFKYAEMAKILQIPQGTVRSRLHRARNALKEKLLEYSLKMGYNTKEKKKNKKK